MTATANVTAETTSHPIKADIDLTVAYPKRKGQAEIHRTGCAHLARTSAYDSDPVDLPATFELGLDDWFDVAPCARKGRWS